MVQTYGRAIESKPLVGIWTANLWLGYMVETCGKAVESKPVVGLWKTNLSGGYGGNLWYGTPMVWNAYGKRAYGKQTCIGAMVQVYGGVLETKASVGLW